MLALLQPHGRSDKWANVSWNEWNTHLLNPRFSLLLNQWKSLYPRFSGNKSRWQENQITLKSVHMRWSITNYQLYKNNTFRTKTTRKEEDALGNESVWMTLHANRHTAAHMSYHPCTSSGNSIGEALHVLLLQLHVQALKSRTRFDDTFFRCSWNSSPHNK